MPAHDSPAPNLDSSRTANLGEPGAFLSLSLISFSSDLPARTTSACLTVDLVLARSGVLGPSNATMSASGDFLGLDNSRRGTGMLDGERTMSVGRCSSAALRAGEVASLSYKRTSLLRGEAEAEERLTLLREGESAADSSSTTRGDGERDTEGEVRGSDDSRRSEEPVGLRLCSLSSISVTTEPTLLVEDERAKEEGTSSVAAERWAMDAVPRGARPAPRLTPLAAKTGSICATDGLACADVSSSCSTTSSMASIPTGFLPFLG